MDVVEAEVIKAQSQKNILSLHRKIALHFFLNLTLLCKTFNIIGRGSSSSSESSRGRGRGRGRGAASAR